jgi:beta-glucosidase
VKELKGFRKISFAPGESQRVDFTISRDELAFWNIDMKNVVEPSSATVWIGPNSTEGHSADFVVVK